MSLDGLMRWGWELLGQETGSPRWRLKSWSGYESYDRNSMAGRYLGGQGAFFSLLKAALLVGKAEAVDSAPLGV